MSVLQRKAQAGKQEHQARSMTVPKSLRIGLAKSADEQLGLALAVIGATQTKCKSDVLTENLEPDGLLVLLDGSEGSIGGAVLGTGLVRSIVQQQTTGRVAPTPDDERRLTATDAALCAPVIDALFQKACGLLDSEQDRAVLGEYRFGARSEDPRLFQLALGDPEYNVIRLTIDVATGALQSTLTLVLPVSCAPARDATLETSGGSGIFQPETTLEKTVMKLKTELAAVLCHVTVPLSRMNTFKPGDVLAIPSEVFEDVGLFSLGGKRISVGVLGQLDGWRALMLGDTDPQEDQEVEYGASEFDHLSSAQKETTVFGTPDDVSNDIITPESLALEGQMDIADPPLAPKLPDLGGVSDENAERAEPVLPELPDLPDLDDLPDFDELPKLNIA